MLTALIEFGIKILMVLAFLVFYLISGRVSPNWLEWVVIPVVLIHLGVMGLGVGIIISSLTTKYRDLGILVGFGVQLWMYATPIVYPLSIMGDSTIRTLIMINPVTLPTEIIRYAILGTGTVIPSFYVLSWAITILVALCGILIFNRVEKTFMDTV